MNLYLWGTPLDLGCKNMYKRTVSTEIVVPLKGSRPSPRPSTGWSSSHQFVDIIAYSFYGF